MKNKEVFIAASTTAILGLGMVFCGSGVYAMEASKNFTNCDVEIIPGSDGQQTEIALDEHGDLITNITNQTKTEAHTYSNITIEKLGPLTRSCVDIKIGDDFVNSSSFGIRMPNGNIRTLSSNNGEVDTSNR